MQRLGVARAPGLHQRGVEIVVEQMQPQHIRWLRGLRRRFFTALSWGSDDMRI